MNTAHEQLSAIRGVLQQRAQAVAAARAAREAAEQRAATERNLFALTVGPVSPLRVQRRALLERARALPVARQRELDEQAVMHEAISDEFDVESLLDTEEALS